MSEWEWIVEKILTATIALIPSIILAIKELTAFTLKRGTCMKKEKLDMECLQKIKKIYPDASPEVALKLLESLKEQNYRHITTEKKSKKKDKTKESNPLL